VLRVHPDDVPEEVRGLCRTLRDRGYRAWVVGGCLRDLLRGRPAQDWDLATDARPEQVQAVFPRVIPTGIQHGTVTVRQRGQSFEVTTLRGEGAYSDGRRPDSVAFVSDLVEDLARRDFTINAMAYDPLDDVLTDPFGGVRDIEARIVRAVGEPLRRFSEDGLRVMRAARFTAVLEFELDPATEAAIAPTLGTLGRVSAERVRDEWLKTLRASRPSRGFAVMARSGALGVSCPALSELAPEVLARTLDAVDLCVGDPVVRLAVLVRCAFPGAAELESWLTGFRLSNQERDRVLRVARFAWPAMPSPGAPDAGLRRFVRQVGRPGLADVLTASEALADQAGEGGSMDALRARLHNAVPDDAALSTRELAVSGKDLMDALGRPPGPWLGSCLDALLEAVIEVPGDNTRARLVELARAHVERVP
jgi:tRNA nucleotidyltransferase (CCA-adding enzyme)